MSKPWWIAILLATSLIQFACSDSNQGAPSVGEAHPDGWILSHGNEALEGVDDCRSCHGVNLQGRGEAVSCLNCHADALDAVASAADLNIENFLAHPWRDQPELFHGNFAQQLSWTRCSNAACHGPDLQGGDLGPSCFLAGCHPEGPPAPHPFFVSPALHGPAAQNDQLYCRNCHGVPPNSFDGGFVGDPQILDAPLGSCFTSQVGLCHATHNVAQAHPNEWIAGHQDVGLQAIDRGCALCHDVRGTGSTLDPICTPCHPGGFE